jgi:hypothetical protein
MTPTERSTQLQIRLPPLLDQPRDKDGGFSVVRNIKLER